MLSGIDKTGLLKDIVSMYSGHLKPVYLNFLVIFRKFFGEWSLKRKS